MRCLSLVLACLLTLAAPAARAQTPARARKQSPWSNGVQEKFAQQGPQATFDAITKHRGIPRPRSLPIRLRLGTMERVAHGSEGCADGRQALIATKDQDGNY